MIRAGAIGLAIAAGALCAFPALGQAAGSGEPSAAAARNDLISGAPQQIAPQPSAPQPAEAVADGAADAPRPVAAPAAARRSGDANPLWAIPLDRLRATRERPLFSVSRRPPPEPVAFVAPVVSEPPPPPPPPPPAEAEKPPMTLVGVVHGPNDQIGIFLDRTGPAVIRLRVGEQDRGWVVRSVDSRTATLEKENQQVKLELPARNAQAGDAGPEIAAITSPPPSPFSRR
jgi:general secretion pathway protein N